MQTVHIMSTFDFILNMSCLIAVFILFALYIYVIQLPDNDSKVSDADYIYGQDDASGDNKLSNRTKIN